MLYMLGARNGAAVALKCCPTKRKKTRHVLTVANNVNRALIFSITYNAPMET